MIWTLKIPPCLWGGAAGISQGALIKGEQDGVVAKEVFERFLRVVRSAGLFAFDATDAGSPAPQAALSAGVSESWHRSVSLEG